MAAAAAAAAAAATAFVFLASLSLLERFKRPSLAVGSNACDDNAVGEEGGSWDAERAMGGTLNIGAGTMREAEEAVDGDIEGKRGEEEAVYSCELHADENAKMVTATRNMTCVTGIPQGRGERTGVLQPPQGFCNAKRLWYSGSVRTGS